MSWKCLRLCRSKNISLGHPQTFNLSSKESYFLVNTPKSPTSYHLFRCIHVVSNTVTSSFLLSKYKPSSSFTFSFKEKSALTAQKWTTDSMHFYLKRGKSTKRSNKKPEYDSDSDTDEDEEQIQGTKTLSFRMQSLRLDGLLKKSLGIARNKAEAAFYDGNIRVNGEKPVKKSQQLKVGDEIDLIKGVSPINSALLNVARIELLSVREDSVEEDQLVVKVRRTKTFSTENYESDPWKKGQVAE